MIVIPMAGESRRFREAGYTQPKFMLPLRGRTVFDESVGSFARYFADTPFLFIVRPGPSHAEFVRDRARALGISDWRVVPLSAPTLGQAETIALGLRAAGTARNQALTIFNIDTFRPGFAHPTAFDVRAVDGYLEVFEDDGANWSFVGPVPEDAACRVARTTEKEPISRLACTGLYHFRCADDFLIAYDAKRALGPKAWERGELYVAPLYNDLIVRGADIRYACIARAAVEFCGVPGEYEEIVYKKKKGHA
ncbi:MAG TPA: capsular biosynthesis protein [Rhodospirillaceae bacterium]|jgi:CTP:molybdopterin cytidylyltransferase MocA|nr:capsular biosynthesis protein [Rhodospirillaceae bacterium]